MLVWMDLARFAQWNRFKYLKRVSNAFQFMHYSKQKKNCINTFIDVLLLLPMLIADYEITNNYYSNAKKNCSDLRFRPSGRNCYSVLYGLVDSIVRCFFSISLSSFNCLFESLKNAAQWKEIDLKSATKRRNLCALQIVSFRLRANRVGISYFLCAPSKYWFCLAGWLNHKFGGR